MKLDNGSAVPDCIRTYFFIVPTLGYFRVEADGKKFHHFDAGCRAAMSDLSEAMRKKTGLSTKLDAQLIREEHENDVPWCEHCRLDEMISVSGTTVSVKPPTLRVTCRVVERSIADAEVLLKTTGPPSAVDRVHTALHGYPKTVCADAQISVGKDPGITELFSLIRQYHPRLQSLGEHQETVLKVLRALCKVVDALNPARDRGSMAHPNEALLDAPEARLFINAARSLLHYLDEKLSG
ncbi:MAG: abortive infection family protein [Candidatus Omnitrophica bacterium]|nr:abortive infection family protein [Candidatus Omnitrophota bacterium]